MKRHLSLIIAAGIFAVSACGVGIIDEEVMQGDIHSQKDPIIQKTLQASYLGIEAGDQIATTKVNQVLQTYGLSYFYNGMNTLSTAFNVDETVLQGEEGCPYVGATAVSGIDTGPSSCRYLAEEVHEKALLAMDQLNPNSAIDESFSNNDGNLAHYRTWYVNGANSALDTTAALLAGTLRQAGVCDNNPTPSSVAYDKGVELGRKLYNEAMNERLKEVGIDFDYPNGSKPSKSIRYCKANLREPALQAALERVDSAVVAKPLCNSIAGDAIEQSQYLTQYTLVLDKYKEGIFSGAMLADASAQTELQKGGCCVASPLVLDLAGDGIKLGGHSKFDMLGKGFKVESTWVRGDDALLARDVNGNGRIDDATELFGNNDTFDNGFANLASHDDNNDGRIDARDRIYHELRLLTATELQTLSAKGVKAIELSYTEGARVDRHGNQFRQIGSFIRTAEYAVLGTGKVVDVWFNY